MVDSGRRGDLGFYANAWDMIFSDATGWRIRNADLQGAKFGAFEFS